MGLPAARSRKHEGSRLMGRPRPKIQSLKGGRAGAAQEEFDEITRVLGASSDDTANYQLARVADLTASHSDLTEQREVASAVNGGLAFMAAIDPADELQAALGLQMLGTHTLALELMRRGKINAEGGKSEAAERYVNMATKTSRTFVAQVEALAKLRSGGKQTVEVNHVYIDQRTQSVINAGGGGPIGKSPQPLEHIAGVPLALGAPMPGQEPLGQPLSVPSAQGSEPLPPARRKQPRRAKREG